MDISAVDVIGRDAEDIIEVKLEYRMTRFLVPLAAIVLIGAEPQADATKKDLERMQGRWTVQQAHRDGKDAPAEALEKMSVKIDGNKLTIDDAESAREEIAELALDPSENPAKIDLKVNHPGDQQTLQGIYKIDGDTLSICWTKHSGARPTEFAAKAGSDHVLFVLKRKK